jgi:hypothetical protein
MPGAKRLATALQAPDGLALPACIHIETRRTRTHGQIESLIGGLNGAGMR